MPYQSEFIVNTNPTTIIIQNKKQHWKYQKRKIAYNPLTFCTDLCCCFFSVYFVFPVLPPAFVRCIQRHRPRPWWMNEWKQPTSSSSSHPLSTKSFLWQVRPCRKRNAKFYYSFHKTYIHTYKNESHFEILCEILFNTIKTNSIRLLWDAAAACHCRAQPCCMCVHTFALLINKNVALMLIFNLFI